MEVFFSSIDYVWEIRFSYFFLVKVSCGDCFTVEILKDRKSRTLVAFGMYLLYELVNKIIDSNYNLKATSNSKSFILQSKCVML